MTLNILLIILLIFGLVALLILWLAEQPATPPMSAARDNEPTPNERDDADRLTNPATCRARGITPAQITVKQRAAAEGSDTGFVPGFTSPEPDEPVEDEPETEEEAEPTPAPAAVVVELVPAANVEAPPAPFVIQGEPTEDAHTYGSLAAKYPVYEDDWGHTGMTGFLSLNAIQDEIERHDAAERPWEVAAA